MALSRSIARVRSGIAEACQRSGRQVDEVLLVAVTKIVPVALILEAAELSIHDFAENYAGELAEKSRAIPARWHFIGALQAGNAPRVADHADVIHSGEPGRGLERVARRAATSGRRISCLIQIDFTGRRHGVDPERTEEAVGWASALEGIEVIGLMTLPPWSQDANATRPFFRRLRELRDGLHARWPMLSELSMGMSGDYEVAVEEGATMVRVGTALFGTRPQGGPPTRGEGT